MTVDEVGKFIGADSLRYLSLAGVRTAVGDAPETHFCSACYTGHYPTEMVLESQIGRARS